MSQLIHAMQNIPTETTENGSSVFAATNSSNLDFFGLASAKSTADASAVLTLFANACAEDEVLALKNLFYMRDIRGGQGRRALFRLCIRDFFSHPDFNLDRTIVWNLLLLIPEYGRWDDLIDLVDCPVVGDLVIELLRLQLRADLEVVNKTTDTTRTTISLLGKWFPLANSVSNKARKDQAILLRRKLFDNSAKKCRETIVALRKYLDVVERHLCAKGFCNIKYDAVPSQAMLRYRKTFFKHDEERFKTYLEEVTSGKKKINTGTLYPHQIVAKSFATSDYKSDEHDMLNTMWNNLKDYTNGENTICVVDTSGSMSSWNNGEAQPIHVALALGLYFAERSSGAFKNAFITFSEDPTIEIVKGDTLYQKLRNMHRAKWDNNTNIEKVFNLILNSAIKFKLPQSELPKHICIISDMEFDTATTYNFRQRDNDTIFEQATQKFHDAGYELPNVIFWNVASRNNNVPVTKDTSGAALVSGFSTSLFQQIVERTTPYEMMLKVLNSSRYQLVDHAFIANDAAKSK